MKMKSRLVWIFVILIPIKSIEDEFSTGPDNILERTDFRF